MPSVSCRDMGRPFRPFSVHGCRNRSLCGGADTGQLLSMDQLRPPNVLSVSELVEGKLVEGKFGWANHVSL